MTFIISIDDEVANGKVLVYFFCMTMWCRDCRRGYPSITPHSRHMTIAYSFTQVWSEEVWPIRMIFQPCEEEEGRLTVKKCSCLQYFLEGLELVVRGGLK